MFRLKFTVFKFQFSLFLPMQSLLQKYNTTKTKRDVIMLQKDCYRFTNVILVERVVVQGFTGISTAPSFQGLFSE